MPKTYTQTHPTSPSSSKWRPFLVAIPTPFHYFQRLQVFVFNYFVKSPEQVSSLADFVGLSLKCLCADLKGI